jgi:putative transposase
MPRIGGRKLYYLLSPHLQQNSIKLGRDAFFDFMRENNLLIKVKRKYCKTTHSHHWMKKYDNLLTHLESNTCEQVLVSDITYITTLEGFAYLFLVTDVYSKRILGHFTSDNMSAESGLKALEMATSALTSTQGVIHHSDGGVQYCSALYTDFLKKRNMFISMTEPASPTQNAVAERVNGILKTEWIYHVKTFVSIKEAQDYIDEVIAIYNEERPHDSLKKLTPVEAHRRSLDGERNLLKPIKKTTQNAGDLAGIGCSECRENKNNGHSILEWPSCDIRHSPQVIPKTNKSPQVRPPLHRRRTNLLFKSPKKKIHLQTT